nr:glycosyltransferase family 39 protein [Cellulomonas sp. JH27-2]
MHVWISAFGASPASVRLASAFAVAAGAAGIVLLGTRLANPRVGVVAGIAFALLPRVTWAAIEARSWAATLALGVWATVALHSALRSRRTGAWILYGVLGALAVATNVYLVMLWLAHGVTVLATARDRVRAWIATACVSALVVGGVVLAAARQSGQLGSTDLTPARLVRMIVVNQWFLGGTPTPTTGGSDTGTDLWKVTSVLLALLAWSVIAFAVVRTRRANPTLLAWTLPWLLAPTVLLVTAALVRPSLYNPRYLTFCAPAVALLLAVGLCELRRRVAVAVSLALALLAAPVYASQRTVLAKSSADLSLVAAELRTNASPGDAVYYGPRDPAIDGRVNRSMRTVALGYPDAVRGLEDIGLAVTPADGATLFGTSITLEPALDRLPPHGTLWVVRREDQAGASADDRSLGIAGLHVVGTWRGPQTEIVELRR